MEVAASADPPLESPPLCRAAIRSLSDILIEEAASAAEKPDPASEGDGDASFASDVLSLTAGGALGCEAAGDGLAAVGAPGRTGLSPSFGVGLFQAPATPAGLLLGSGGGEDPEAG